LGDVKKKPSSMHCKNCSNAAYAGHDLYLLFIASLCMETFFTNKLRKPEVSFICMKETDPTHDNGRYYLLIAN
jgi:hypothetical protein